MEIQPDLKELFALSTDIWSIRTRQNQYANGAEQFRYRPVLKTFKELPANSAVPADPAVNSDGSLSRHRKRRAPSFCPVMVFTRLIASGISAI